MKLIIASDIHGSSFFCRQLANSFEKEGADRLLLLGDILYHGPRNGLPQEHSPSDVVSILNSLKDNIICVRGNCDTEVDQSVLKFPCLADYALLAINNKTFFATHGHLYNENNLPPLKTGDILLNGHTHIPKCYKYGSYIYMNPGSVSLPKGGSKNGYILTYENTFLWKDFDGNVNYEFIY